MRILVIVVLLVGLVGCASTGDAKNQNFVEGAVGDGGGISGQETLPNPDGALNVGGGTTEKFSHFSNVDELTSVLGYGYDVINSRYITASNVLMYEPIFDIEKLKNSN